MTSSADTDETGLGAEFGLERAPRGEAATKYGMERTGNKVRGIFVNGMGKGFEETYSDKHSPEFTFQI